MKKVFAVTRYVDKEVVTNEVVADSAREAKKVLGGKVLEVEDTTYAFVLPMAELTESVKEVNGCTHEVAEAHVEALYLLLKNPPKRTRKTEEAEVTDNE